MSHIEFKTGQTVRLRSKKGIKNREGTPDWYLGVYDGALTTEGGLSNKTEWLVTCNDIDDTICLKSNVGNHYLGITEDLNVILNADPKTTGKFKVFWQANGKVCLQSFIYSNKKNRTGKNGPHIGHDPKGALIGNAGTGDWGQWDIITSGVNAIQSPSHKLLLDYNKHRELMSGPFTLIQTPTKNVLATLTNTYVLPNLKVANWCIVAAAPPTPLQTQMVKSSHLKIFDSKETSQIGTSKIIQAGSHYVIRTLAKAQGPNSIHSVVAKYEIEADLYSIKLTKVNQGDFIPSVAPLSQSTREFHLRETSLINFRNTAFAQWLDANQLHPMLLSDGTVEPLLCFAYRVHLFIKTHFSYIFAKDVKGRKATDTIVSRSSDCGGYCILYSAIMRTHGIPCRSLFGRWANSGTETEKRVHVKAEFYADGIGWIPIDPSCSITGDHKEPFTLHFGQDSGEFITMHLDHNIEGIETTILDDKQQQEFMQGPAYWVSGDGDFNGSTTKSIWTVENK